MGLIERIHELALVSDEEGATTRLYLSPAHRRAVALVSGWMREAGLAVSLDAAATVVGRSEAASGGDAAPLLLLGSHIDTVRNAGAFDGCLGVLAAIEALGQLAREHVQLPFAVELLAFGDEEGVRFAPTLAGSRAVAGRFDPSALEAMDADGISLRAALAAFGCDAAALGANLLRRDRARAYVELHIEQGPVLEAADLPLGVVTGIAGAGRFAVEVTGRAGHAGTVPMGLRRDALAGAAAMVLAVRDAAREAGDVVATVGRIEALPGATNVIPGRCRFTIDIRSESDERRRATEAAIEARLRAIAAAEGLDLAWTRTHEAEAVACDPRLVGLLEAAAMAVAPPPRLLASGAGHDAMAIAPLCPVGMIFVRCRGGISHHPDEHVSEADAALAVASLVRFLKDLTPEMLADPDIVGEHRT